MAATDERAGQWHAEKEATDNTNSNTGATKNSSKNSQQTYCSSYEHKRKGRQTCIVFELQCSSSNLDIYVSSSHYYITRRDSDFMKYPRKVRPGNLNTILQIELIWIICRCAFARTKATVPPSPHKYIFEKPKVWSLCKGGQSVFPQSKLVGHGGIEVVCGMCGEWRANIRWQEETNPKKGYSTVQVCKESDATTCQMSHSHLPQMSEDV